ncbi:hypothetical protein AB0J63_26050 [Streptosporangium canum]|uniref:hypothetical protein n=1 Tax=Streptosporangium canum TaxID=324952 RepID=UPI003431C877
MSSASDSGRSAQRRMSVAGPSPARDSRNFGASRVFWALRAGDVRRLGLPAVAPFAPLLFQPFLT